MNETSIHELAAAYALDAVDQQERVLFEAHLPGCDRCRRAVEGFTEVTAQLSEGIEQPPPASLRERVLDRVAREPQEPAGSSRTTGRHEAGRPAPRRTSWLIGLAAAALVAVGGVVATQMWPAQQSVPTAEQVMQAEDARRYTEELDGSTITVVHSDSVGRSVVVTEDMPAPPQGQDYQLWFVHEDGTAVSAGLMPYQDTDRVEVLLEGEPEGAVAVGVTVEPAGGSQQPTSDPLVAVPIQG